MAELVLVIAQHHENVRWAENLPSGWEPWVVTKDRDVPNEGREASSFLWAMRQLRGRTGTSAFVQGNPFHHEPDLLGKLRPSNRFRWLGHPHLSTADGGPHHVGLPVKARFEKWTGKPFPGEVWFAAGGQFILPLAMLRNRPAVWYENLQAQACEDENPWVLERLWGLMLGGEAWNEAGNQ